MDAPNKPGGPTGSDPFDKPVRRWLTAPNVEVTHDKDASPNLDVTPNNDVASNKDVASNADVAVPSTAAGKKLSVATPIRSLPATFP